MVPKIHIFLNGPNLKRRTSERKVAGKATMSAPDHGPVNSSHPSGIAAETAIVPVEAGHAKSTVELAG